MLDILFCLLYPFFLSNLQHCEIVERFLTIHSFPEVDVYQKENMNISTYLPIDLSIYMNIISGAMLMGGRVEEKVDRVVFLAAGLIAFPGKEIGR